MVVEKFKTLMTLFNKKQEVFILYVLINVICYMYYYKRHAGKPNIHVLGNVIKLLHSTGIVICTKPQ